MLNRKKCSALKSVLKIQLLCFKFQLVMKSFFKSASIIRASWRIQAICESDCVSPGQIKTILYTRGNTEDKLNTREM